MNWKEFGRSGLNEVLSLHFHGRAEENHNISDRIAGVPAKTQAGYLLNTMPLERPVR
jgi:hypothetical protein